MTSDMTEMGSRPQSALGYADEDSSRFIPNDHLRLRSSRAPRGLSGGRNEREISSAVSANQDDAEDGDAADLQEEGEGFEENEGGIEDNEGGAEEVAAGSSQISGQESIISANGSEDVAVFGEQSQSDNNEQAAAATAIVSRNLDPAEDQNTAREDPIARRERLARRKAANQALIEKRNLRKAEELYAKNMEAYMKSRHKFEDHLRRLRHDREVVFCSMGMAPGVAKLAAFNELLLDEQHQLTAFEARHKPTPPPRKRSNTTRSNRTTSEKS
jgi:hypothetical protein